MRIGIFGGTFDPVHVAHLVLAEACREECQLDQIRFVPAFQSPLKTGQAITSGKQRLAMLDFATAGIPEFVVDRREIKREGVNFTCDTLAEFRTEFPDDEFFFLMGSDSLHDLPRWKNPEQLAELARIVAVNRGPITDQQMAELLAPLPTAVRSAVEFVTMPGLDVSASQLRELVASGKSIRFLTPRPVERYIAEQGLYRSAEEA
jgi:nicotinate-nucleotide adenylyltransferase